MSNYPSNVAELQAELIRDLQVENDRLRARIAELHKTSERRGTQRDLAVAALGDLVEATSGVQLPEGAATSRYRAQTLLGEKA